LDEQKKHQAFLLFGKVEEAEKMGKGEKKARRNWKVVMNMTSLITVYDRISADYSIYSIFFTRRVEDLFTF
jgi:hypothetical protein